MLFHAMFVLLCSSTLRRSRRASTFGMFVDLPTAAVSVYHVLSVCHAEVQAEHCFFGGVLIVQVLHASPLRLRACAGGTGSMTQGRSRLDDTEAFTRYRTYTCSTPHFRMRSPSHCVMKVAPSSTQDTSKTRKSDRGSVLSSKWPRRTSSECRRLSKEARQ